MIYIGKQLISKKRKIAIYVKLGTETKLIQPCSSIHSCHLAYERYPVLHTNENFKLDGS